MKIGILSAGAVQAFQIVLDCQPVNLDMLSAVKEANSGHIFPTESIHLNHLLKINI